VANTPKTALPLPVILAACAPEKGALLSPRRFRAQVDGGSPARYTAKRTQRAEVAVPKALTQAVVSGIFSWQLQMRKEFFVGKAVSRFERQDVASCRETG
jgi:hypothetical protein